MIVAIHQPSYWPWLGLLDKIARCDVFVLLDNVQLNKDSYQRRNIFLVNGEKRFLTVPIVYRLGVKINEAMIKDHDFPKKHLEILRSWYLRAPFYKEIETVIRPIYSHKYERLIDILNKTMLVSMEAFDIKKELIYASDLAASDTKARLVLNICKELGADTYLSGKGALSYFEDSDYRDFSATGIKIVFQEFTHYTYPQYNCDNFVSGLGSLDILFNCGLEQAKKMFYENIRLIHVYDGNEMYEAI